MDQPAQQHRYNQVPQDVGTSYLTITQVITPDMATSGPAIRPTYVRTVYTPQAWWFSWEEYTQTLITHNRRHAKV